MLSVVIPVVELDSTFWKRMGRLDHYLRSLILENFEIIVVPNGPQGNSEMGPYNEQIRVLPRLVQPGKGRAVQTGFREALGSQVLMVDADLPYDLTFIEKALELLDMGYDLVYSNRRHPESYFRVKVPTLHLAFRRHCFGLLFNKMARLFLKIRSKDTQAGMKMLSRRLAKEVARVAQCPGFLFDLEIFLLAQLHQYKISDLPVVFNLENEKSSVRLIQETLAILTWLPRIRWGLFSGNYLPKPLQVRAELS